MMPLESPDMALTSTESDDAADVFDYAGNDYGAEFLIGADIPEAEGVIDSSYRTLTQDHVAWSADPMDVHTGQGTIVGDSVDAVMKDSNYLYTTSESDGELSSTAGTPEGPAGYAFVEAHAVQPVNAEADRVSALERQLAETKGQLK